MSETTSQSGAGHRIARRDRPVNRRLWKRIIRNKTLYFFLLPAMLYLIIFNYMPMYGIQMAFRDFKPTKGIWGSEWAGLKYFLKFFESYHFWALIKNTISISFYQLIVGFPFPILLALVLNYTPSLKLRRITQTVTYAPHFISVVVLAGMLFVFLSPTNGIVNIIIRQLGGSRIDFMGDPDIFRHLYVWSGVWQSMGWSSIIYISALTSVSPEYHEAAIVDGATKLKRIWYIDIPAILPTAIIILILNTGYIMNVGFEKTFLLQTAPNLSKSEVISTYVYKIGIQGSQYSYASAIGLFNNIINFVVLVCVNKIANKTTNSGLW